MRIRKTKKRGQVTVFIIIGLVILLIIVLAMIMKSRTTERELTPKLDTVPAEFEELQRFVVGCVDKTGEEAMVKVGEHAGYIDPLDPELTGRSFDLGRNPTRSEVVYMDPQYAVPYWWYLKTPFDCTACQLSDEDVPSIEELQDQINRYVDHAFKDCIGDFSEFKEKGIEVTENGDPETTSTIGQDTVSIYVNYPITAKLGDKEASLSNFPVDIELRFREIYDLAKAITLGEENNQYLETLLMHLISSYSQPDWNKLPPLSSFEEGFDVVMWSKTNVQMMLTNLLKSYIPLIQVENTADYHELDTKDQFQKEMYNVFTLHNDVEHPNLDVHFIYLEWPIYFDITPRSGELLKPIITRRKYPWNIAPLTQTNLYEFFYDVSFPVVVEIRDKDALKGRGYSFLFALEGNVLDNKNLALWHIGEGTLGPYDYNNVEYSVGKLEDESVMKYVPETDESVKEPFSKSPKNLFCNKNQLLSGDISVDVFDTGYKPIEGATVSFGCGKYASCSLGETDENGIYKGKFPVCIGGGYISIDKNGYAPYTKSNLTVKVDEKDSFRLMLQPVKNISVTARLIPISYIEGRNSLSLDTISSLRENADGLRENQQAIITIRRIKSDPFEEEFSQVVTIDGPDDKENIGLAKGEYIVQGALVDQDGFIIPAHDEKVGVGLRTVAVPEMQMKPSVLGGVLINENNGYWIVNSHDLASSRLIFYMLISDPPKTMADIINMTEYETYSTKYRTLVEPELG